MRKNIDKRDISMRFVKLTVEQLALREKKGLVAVILTVALYVISLLTVLHFSTY